MLPAPKRLLHTLARVQSGCWGLAAAGCCRSRVSQHLDSIPKGRQRCCLHLAVGAPIQTTAPPLHVMALAVLMTAAVPAALQLHQVVGARLLLAAAVPRPGALHAPAACGAAALPSAPGVQLHTHACALLLVPAICAFAPSLMMCRHYRIQDCMLPHVRMQHCAACTTTGGPCAMHTLRCCGA